MDTQRTQTMAGDVGVVRDEQVLATPASYAEAQGLVDRLSDGGFPVEHVRIIGLDMRLVEDVTGRLTKGRAAMAGAASGAWFGLLFALLLTLFAGPGLSWLLVLLGGAVLGAIWGAVLGYVAHSATGGRRDFASTSRFEAGRYEVRVLAAHAAEAQRLLAAV